MHNPIRVLQLVTKMDYGGAETMVMNYYRNIDREKVQFDFLLHRSHTMVYEDEIKALGGRIYRAMPLEPLKFGAYKRLLRRFLDEHGEYKIIHSQMSESGYFMFRQAKKHGVPVRICHAHNDPTGVWDIKMPVRTYFKIRIRKLTTHMFACSRASGGWLFGKKNSPRLIIQRNATDPRLFAFSAERRAKARESLGLDGKLVLGHIGRFVPQKNHKMLMEIFSAVKSQRRDAVLLLIGEGELREQTERQAAELGISDSVMFLGTRSDVAELMQAMDAFVFPSHFEGLSVAVIEVVAAGLPCFVSDNVSHDVDISPLIRRLPITQGVSPWEDALSEFAPIERQDQTGTIADAGFDIRQNARWLEEFYLNAVL